MAHYLLMKRHK